MSDGFDIKEVDDLAYEVDCAMVSSDAADVGMYPFSRLNVKEVVRAVFEADCVMIDTVTNGAYSLHSFILQSYHIEMSFLPSSAFSPAHNLY